MPTEITPSVKGFNVQVDGQSQNLKYDYRNLVNNFDIAPPL